MTKSISFDDIIRYLELPPEAEIWRNGWDESQTTFSDSTLFFLTLPWLNEICGTFNIASDFYLALCDELGRYHNNKLLMQLLWHCHCLCFKKKKAWQVISQWPQSSALPNDWGPLFYVFLLLSGAPRVFDYHESKGIPREITIDTLSDLELWAHEYYHRNGRWGLHSLGWLSLHSRGVLYKLGRLQFEISHFVFDYHVCRNRITSQTIALAGEGMRFRSDGQFDGANGINDEAAWNASYLEIDDCIAGHLISATGEARPELIMLSRKEWDIVMEKSTPILNVHVPATGAMDYNGCGDSFRQALEFFPRHFPEHQFWGFTCHSWLLDPQLADYLPPTSNIVRFQREFYLLPLPGAGDRQIFGRVFGDRPEKLETAPRDTSLRRAVLDHVERGGHWHGAGGFILNEDIDWRKRAG